MAYFAYFLYFWTLCAFRKLLHLEIYHKCINIINSRIRSSWNLNIADLFTKLPIYIRISRNNILKDENYVSPWDWLFPGLCSLQLEAVGSTAIIYNREKHFGASQQTAAQFTAASHETNTPIPNRISHFRTSMRFIINYANQPVTLVVSMFFFPSFFLLNSSSSTYRKRALECLSWPIRASTNVRRRSPLSNFL